MGSRWAIANDPKLLARIAAQELAKKDSSRIAQVAPQKPSLGIEDGVEAKKPSAARKRAAKVATNNQDSRMDTLAYDKESDTLTIVFAGASLLSHNASLRMHNAQLTALKRTWMKRVEALTLLNLTTYDAWKSNKDRQFPLLVDEVYATGEGNLLDVESVVAACKPIIDALVKARYVPDDKPEYIAQPLGYTYKQACNGLVLVLRPSPRPWGCVSDTAISAAKTIRPLPVIA